MKTYTAKELSSPANAALVDEIALMLARTFIEDPSHKWLVGNSSHKAYVAAMPEYMRTLVNLALACDAVVMVTTEEDLSMSSAPPPPLQPSSLVTSTITTTATTTETSSSSPPIKSDEPPQPTTPTTSSSSHPKVLGASLTIPPHGNAAFDSLLVSLRSGGLTLPFRCGFGLMWRLLVHWLPMLTRIHDKLFPDHKTKYDNWYLFYIGVHVDYYGRGLGSLILDEVKRYISRCNDLALAQRLGDIPANNGGGGGGGGGVVKKEGDGKVAVSAPPPLFLEASTVDSRRLYQRVGFEDMFTDIYGKLDEGESVRVAEDGTVLGGRLFVMIWRPS